MAIDVVQQVVDLFPGQPIYVYHEIVHNKHVVNRFVDSGVRFVESLNDVPIGSVIVFSAHGVSPEIRRLAQSRDLTAIDATCPLVTKVHNESLRYARQGYQILLIGHKDHQEVVGTFGEAPEATQVVESPRDIPYLHIKDPGKLIYLTQTTLSTDDAATVIDALKAAFPLIKAPPSSDICYATTNRQHAVRVIAPECDAVVVVGSRNSSNSVRLTEISANVGTPAYRVDDVSELNFAWFPNGNETVLLTAGASAPEDLVATICRTLIEKFGGTIDVRDISEEDVEFGIPGTLKRMMRSEGIDPADRVIRISAPNITAEIYGAVPITVSASRR